MQSDKTNMRNISRKNNDVKHQFNGLKNILSQVSWLRDDLIAMAADFDLDHDRLMLLLNKEKGIDVTDNSHDESFNFHHVDNTFFNSEYFWKRKFKDKNFVEWTQMENAIRSEGVKLSDGLNIFIRNKIVENQEFKNL